MMTNRSKTTYQKILYDFVKEDILVICPKCQDKGIVKTNEFSFLAYNENKIRLVCPNCGFNKTLEELPGSVLYSSGSETIHGRNLAFGGPFDPFFLLPLWLTEIIGDNLLWAYNLSHLIYLKEHVGSLLRERNNIEYQNKSLGSRLPKWMTSKKNREEIIKRIERLMNK